MDRTPGAPGTEALRPAADQVEWEDLRLFRLLAEELSFTRAAQRARVSQPWMSQRIARMERRLRVSLFRRNRHQVGLTPAGHRLLGFVVDVSTLWDRTVRDLPGRETDRGDVAASPTGARRAARAPLRLAVYDINPVRMPAYLAESPEVRDTRFLIQDSVRAGVDSVVAGKADALLSYIVDGSTMPAPPPTLYTCTVLRERLHVLLPRTHRLAARPTVSVTELVGDPWVIPQEEVLRKQVLALLLRYGVEPLVTHVTSSNEVQRFLIASGQAVDLSTPLMRPNDGVILKSMTEPVDSVFALYVGPGMTADRADALIRAVRRWYVDGLLDARSPWLSQLLRPDAHPTLRAALSLLPPDRLAAVEAMVRDAESRPTARP
ncbi:LysR family transcriptional regulator [Micromonospora sp. NPDC000089]|uniref:LysR family transcriptional regulator n=1 Tax=unclassified Micromonospora TaxID=2617518 RepID=UPI0036CFA152